MYAFFGWVLGTVLAVAIVVAFGVDEVIVGVLLGFGCSMVGVAIGGSFDRARL